MGLSDWTAATSTAAGWWVGGLFASARGTGCLQFGECSPRELAEVVAAGRVAPVLVGDLPGERAQFRGHARGQAGNAAPAERAGHRRGEAEALQRFAFSPLHGQRLAGAGAVFADLLVVCRRPAQHAGGDVKEAWRERGEGVLDGRRYRRVGGAGGQAVLDELAQGEGEHALGDARD